VDFSVKNPSPQGEKQAYFPSGNPKNAVFRRASKARPYDAFQNARSFRNGRFFSDIVDVVDLV
jgi:hypothetical protein